MPPGLLKLVDIIGDRLVSKAVQLVQNKTTNFMSVRCKMDGGNILTGFSQVLFIIVAWLLHCGFNMDLVGLQKCGS